MRELHDTVIVGGGQAGLAMSYWLSEQRQQHVVLERTRVAERWHSERWNSLYFQFPNWALQLPGCPSAAKDPEGFSHRTEVARYVEEYAELIGAPVRCGVEVLSLHRGTGSDSYVLSTRQGTYEARRVVVATGPFQRDAIPDFSARLGPDIVQTSASGYFSPAQLPSGAVLVVGSGNSGCQIAEELNAAGRKVYLCVGRHRGSPRRYRGSDMLRWLVDLGRTSITIDSYPGRMQPPPILVTGAGGGHDMDLRALARDGVVLLGKLQGVQDGTAYFAGELEQDLAAGDASRADFIRAVDEHIRVTGLELPEEEAVPAPRTPVQAIPSLDLAASGITSVIWCTGYKFDFQWLKLPVLDDAGIPIQRRGISPSPGLYFLGLHWMHTIGSAAFFGVGNDAKFIAEHMRRPH